MSFFHCNIAVEAVFENMVHKFHFTFQLNVLICVLDDTMKNTEGI